MKIIDNINSLLGDDLILSGCERPAILAALLFFEGSGGGGTFLHSARRAAMLWLSGVPKSSKPMSGCWPTACTQAA